MNVLVLVALLLVLPVAYNASYLELSTAWMLLDDASDLEGKISVIWRNATTSTGAICFCDDGVFDLSAGNVVCRELEYDEADLQPSVAGNGSWTIHSVHCDGDEDGLEDCSWTVGAKSQCQLNIVLKCYNHKGDDRWRYFALFGLFAWIMFMILPKIRVWCTKRRAHHSSATLPPRPAVVASVSTAANQPQCTQRQPLAKTQVNPSRAPAPHVEPLSFPPPYTAMEDTSVLAPPPAYETLYPTQDPRVETA